MPETIQPKRIAATDAPPSPVRAGRPTREQAQARHAQLLDCAFDHFLDKGFEPTTIEALAAEVSMTKRTVYARYPDKASLFRAAIQRGTERRAASAETIAATRADTLEETLVGIAMLRIQLAGSPEGVKLQRLINTEAYRFPDIFQTYYEIAALPTVRFLADILDEETRAGRLAIEDAMLSSTVFMSMVVSAPVRFLISGNELPAQDVDRRVRFAVRLFLKGALPRRERRAEPDFIRENRTMPQEDYQPEVRQRCVVVTGASSGIGRASAAAFARMGWHVIGTGRDRKRSEDAEAEIRAAGSENARVDMLRGDFSEMHEVRRVAGEIRALTDRVDVLVNNVGGVRDGYHATSEGLEATFAANHLAPFLLTRELQPLLERAAGDAPPGQVRIIAVSSSGHRACAGMRWYDLMMKAAFEPGTAYCQAKLANLLHTRALHGRLIDKGIVALAMHPGRVGSNFASHGDEAMQAYMAANECAAPEQPARTIVWLATDPDLGGKGGHYFHDLAEETPAPQALDDFEAEKLWQESERILEQVLEAPLTL